MNITARCTRVNSLYFIVAVLVGPLIFPLQGTAADAATIILGPPEADSNLNGNSGLAPFDSALPERFQQVYSSSTFDILNGVGGGTILEISFRVDASLGHPFDATIPYFQLNLSTTSRSVDGLSSLFDENVGLDDTVVISPGELRINSNGGGGFTSFDIGFFLSTPFEYN